MKEKQRIFLTYVFLFKRIYILPPPIVVGIGRRRVLSLRLFDCHIEFVLKWAAFFWSGIVGGSYVSRDFLNERKWFQTEGSKRDFILYFFRTPFVPRHLLLHSYSFVKGSTSELLKSRFSSLVQNRWIKTSHDLRHMLHQVLNLFFPTLNTLL